MRSRGAGALMRADAHCVFDRAARPNIMEGTMPIELDTEKLSNDQEHAAEGRKSSKVGYCNPPKHSQFKPGQSGNPLGRPKGTISFAPELIDELIRTIAAPENETDAVITNKRAIVKKLVAAAKEDAQLAISLINLCAKLSRGRETDPRAAEDEAFVEKLADRESQATEEIAASISSPILRGPNHE